MDVIDLTDEYKPLYFVCLEDWSEEMREAGSCKELWYDGMKKRGLRIKLVRDDAGKVGGMIQYGPIEYSFAEGNDLYFIYCIWVHGYKEGRGNFQKRGMGKALLQAAEADVREMGANGMAAWGIFLPFWMRASWFRKQGYSKVDRQGLSVLLWKPFTDDASPPRWIQKKKIPEKIPGKVAVTAFISGWCPAQNLKYERAKRASSEFDDNVVFMQIDTMDRNVLKEWGIADGLFIDGKEVRTGPPPSYDKIRNLINKRIKRL